MEESTIIRWKIGIIWFSLGILTILRLFQSTDLLTQVSIPIRLITIFIGILLAGWCGYQAWLLSNEIETRHPVLIITGIFISTLWMTILLSSKIEEAKNFWLLKTETTTHFASINSVQRARGFFHSAVRVQAFPRVRTH